MTLAMDVNLTKWVFILMTTIVGSVGFMIHAIEEFVPLSIRKSFKYGKYAEKKEHRLVKYFEFPKRWFGHFYLFAAPTATACLLMVSNRYFFGGKLPEIVCWILDAQMGSSRSTLVSAEACFLAMFLITIQCWKRLYETRSVSVFSDAKINISHYMVGYIHYLGTLTAILGESRGFTKNPEVNFNLANLTKIDFSCTLVFLTASVVQLHSNFILANLRKDKKGVVVTKSYKIPEKGLFNFVTGALQFTEIMMYFMLTIILWKSSTFHYIFLWVLVNQIQTAVDSHVWYRNTFKNYPKDRKICIPFIF